MVNQAEAFDFDSLEVPYHWHQECQTAPLCCLVHEQNHPIAPNQRLGRATKLQMSKSL